MKISDTFFYEYGHFYFWYRLMNKSDPIGVGIRIFYWRDSPKGPLFVIAFLIGMAFEFGWKFRNEEKV